MLVIIALISLAAALAFNPPMSISGKIYDQNQEFIEHPVRVGVKNLNNSFEFSYETSSGDYEAIVQGEYGDIILIQIHNRGLTQEEHIMLRGVMRNVDIVWQHGILSDNVSVHELRKPFLITGSLVYEDGSEFDEPVNYEIENLRTGESHKGTTQGPVLDTFIDIIHGRRGDAIALMVQSDETILVSELVLIGEENRLEFSFPQKQEILKDMGTFFRIAASVLAAAGLLMFIFWRKRRT